MDGSPSTLQEENLLSRNNNEFLWVVVIELIVALLIASVLFNVIPVPRWGLWEPYARWGLDSVIYAFIVVALLVVAFNTLRVMD